MGAIKLELTNPARRLQLENEKKTKALVKEIIEAKNELYAATQNFNFADCDDLVDFYAHKILAAELKYNMLIKKAKENGISYAPYMRL